MSSLSARAGRVLGSRQRTIVSKPGLQDDNRERFSKLVLPHLADAYALAYRITGSHADAEDVLQEASLRAFRAVGNVVESSARGWVMTIMRNTAFTWIRKNRPSAVFAVDDLEGVEVAQTDPAIRSRDDDDRQIGHRDKHGDFVRPIPGDSNIARSPRTVLSRDCRANEGADRHGNVAACSRAQPVSHGCCKSRGKTGNDVAFVRRPRWASLCE